MEFYYSLISSTLLFLKLIIVQIMLFVMQKILTKMQAIEASLLNTKNGSLIDIFVGIYKLNVTNASAIVIDATKQVLIV